MTLICDEDRRAYGKVPMTRFLLRRKEVSVECTHVSLVDTMGAGTKTYSEKGVRQYEASSMR